MASKRYVKQTGDGGWDVIKEGHSRATAHAETKAQAVARARSIASREGGGEIRVVNGVGKVVDSSSVRSGRRERARSRTTTRTVRER